MVLFFILDVGILAVAIGAAVVGLWEIALVDVIVYITVALGLRACAVPARRPSVSYSEIKARQEALLPVVAQEDAEAVVMLQADEVEDTVEDAPLAA